MLPLDLERISMKVLVVQIFSKQKHSVLCLRDQVTLMLSRQRYKRLQVSLENSQLWTSFGRQVH